MKLKATFAVLSSALLLQGCIAGVVVGSAAVATKTATDPRSVGTQWMTARWKPGRKRSEQRPAVEERRPGGRHRLSGQSAVDRPVA